MHRNSVADRPKAVTYNIVRILMAFVAGLVTVFGGALVYSNLQQRREPVSAAQLPRPEQPVPSAELPTSAIAPTHDSPESSIRADDWKQSTPSTSAASPEPSGGNEAVGGRPAETTLPTQPRPFNEHGTGNSQAVPRHAPVQGSGSVSSAGALPSAPQVNDHGFSLPLVPNLDVAQPRKDLSAPEHYTPGNGQLSGGTAEPPQNHPESVRSEPASKVVVVPASTTLEVRLSETLSSDRNRPGDVFRATLASPLVVSGYVLAEAGATVLGRIETSHKAPLIGGRSELSVALTEIGTTDGQMTRVETGWRKIKGVRSTLTSTIGTVMGAATGTVKGAGTANSALEESHESRKFMAGPRTAVFPAGAQMTFILIAPFTTTGTRPH